MSTTSEVSSITFVLSNSDQRKTGLLGFVSFVINSCMRIDGVAVRRTRKGHLTLSFPSRRDANGKQHPYIRPTSTTARIEIERAIFAAIPTHNWEKTE